MSKLHGGVGGGFIIAAILAWVVGWAIGDYYFDQKRQAEVDRFETKCYQLKGVPQSETRTCFVQGAVIPVD